MNLEPALGFIRIHLTCELKTWESSYKSGFFFWPEVMSRNPPSGTELMQASCLIDCRCFVEFFRNPLRNDLAMVSPLKLRINKQDNHVLSIAITCLFQGLTILQIILFKDWIRVKFLCHERWKVWCSYCHHLVGKQAFPDLHFVVVSVLFFPAKRC